MHTQTSDTHFRRVSPFNITPIKRAHNTRTYWYRRPYRLIYRYQVKEKYQQQQQEEEEKGMDTQYKIKQMLYPTNYHLLAAQQEPYKKAQLLTKTIWVFWEQSQENGPLAEKWQDRKSKRTRQNPPKTTTTTKKQKNNNKKTREEIEKGNQMTAMRFQTGSEHQTSPAFLRGNNQMEGSCLK